MFDTNHRIETPIRPSPLQSISSTKTTIMDAERKIPNESDEIDNGDDRVESIDAQMSSDSSDCESIVDQSNSSPPPSPIISVSALIKTKNSSISSSLSSSTFTALPTRWNEAKLVTSNKNNSIPVDLRIPSSIEITATDNNNNSTLIQSLSSIKNPSPTASSSSSSTLSASSISLNNRLTSTLPLFTGTNLANELINSSLGSHINKFSSPASSSSSSTSSSTSASLLPTSITASVLGSNNLNNNPLMTANQILVTNSRKQREFIPDSKKDESYWDRRKRNNEAAKRSREKRRISDLVLETRVLELTRENSILKAELFAIKEKFGISPNQHFIDPESVSLPLPENTTKIRRSRLFSTILSGNPVNLFPNNGSTTDFTSAQSNNQAINNNNESMSPNSQSSSSSEIHASASPPNYNNHLTQAASQAHQPNNLSQSSPSSTTSSSPQNICSFLAQHHHNQSTANVFASLGHHHHTPILPILSNHSSSMASAKSSLPFKLRHKASNNQNPSRDLGHIANSVGHSLAAHLNQSMIIPIRQDSQTSTISNNDSEASNDSTTVLQSSNNLESSNENLHGIEQANNEDKIDQSIDSLLKTENFALKSELQRLATEVATLKNVLVLNHQTSSQTKSLYPSITELMSPNKPSSTPSSPKELTLEARRDRFSSIINSLSKSNHLQSHIHHNHNSKNSNNLSNRNNKTNTGNNKGNENNSSTGHSSNHSHHLSHSPPLTYSEDLDSKDLLKNVIQFRKLNDIIV
ncbi:Nuclear factor interleukin-3-regulated protein [Sarcoptes scabiei]|uniref:Nuclear factor interleukin-3-regulated protein n=1 Tax=Sarcoptes scabiei TaxID=52283 RepID=A0A834R7M8_SARSC|nr:Nuclear factor interleukin-3-regulated protein [Sarcoptes scabiei]